MMVVMLLHRRCIIRESVALSGINVVFRGIFLTFDGKLEPMQHFCRFFCLPWTGFPAPCEHGHSSEKWSKLNQYLKKRE